MRGEYLFFVLFLFCFVFLFVCLFVFFFCFVCFVFGGFDLVWFFVCLFVCFCGGSAASSQLQKYLEENDLYGKKQSAYRKCTETALIRVQNDILRALDHRNDVLLVLLDLSAAFDTVDHQVLLKWLRDDFGVCESALKLCAS